MSEGKRRMKRMIQFSAFLLSVSLSIFLLTETTFASVSDLFQQNSPQALDDFLNGLSAARASVSSSSTSSSVGPIHNYASDKMKVFAISPDTLQVYAILPNGSGYQAAQFSVNTPTLTAKASGQTFSTDNQFYIRVFYRGKNAEGRHVFQINLYDAGGVLLDDRYTFTRDLAPSN